MPNQPSFQKKSSSFGKVLRLIDRSSSERSTSWTTVVGEDNDNASAELTPSRFFRDKPTKPKITENLSQSRSREHEIHTKQHVKTIKALKERDESVRRKSLFSLSFASNSDGKKEQDFSRCNLFKGF